LAAKEDLKGKKLTARVRKPHQKTSQPEGLKKKKKNRPSDGPNRMGTKKAKKTQKHPRPEAGCLQKKKVNLGRSGSPWDRQMPGKGGETASLGTKGRKLEEI